jgi:hypothetical protein
MGPVLGSRQKRAAHAVRPKSREETPKEGKQHGEAVLHCTN